MKKTLFIIVSLVLLLGIFGCDKKTTTTTTLAPTTVTTVNSDPVFNGVQNKSVVKGTATFNVLDGITVTDPEDGDLTGSIVIVSNPVDLKTVGDYTVALSVTDSGQKLVEASFVVSVVLSVDEQKVIDDISAFQLALDASGNYILPTTGTNGSSIIWSTNKVNTISKKGFVIRPGIGENPINVTITGRFSYGKYTQSVSYPVVVQPRTELNGITSSVTVPFEGTSEEYVVANKDEVKLFFADNGALPYIDVETFIRLINGAIDSDIINVVSVGEDGLRVEYSVEYEDFDGSTVTEDYWAYIDFTENTFTVNNFNFFENYVAETTSDYGEGLNYVDALYGEGSEVEIPLGFYNFDLLIHNDNETTLYLMPLHVADLLFAGGLYYDVYYNGDKLWGIDTFTISSPDEAGELLLNQIRTSSYNSLTAPADIKWATFDFLALSLDYFYGLRNRYSVNSAYEIIATHARDMIIGSDTLMYQKVFNVAYGLDDLHTSHVFSGYYEAPYDMTLYLNDLGPRTLDFYNGLWAVQDLLTAKYGGYENLPKRILLDNERTAIIPLTGFTIDTPDDFKIVLDSLPSTVENVVIDLSYNTGGNLGAVLRIFGYMTENTIMYHSQNPADGATVTYYIESDYVAYDFNWYILTSSVTFSAANLMASIAKEQNIATVIGKNSSGGASSIGAIYSPDGSCLLISTNNVLSTRTGDENSGYEYISIEDGIVVEYLLSNVTSDAQIVAAIAATQATE